MKQKNKQQQNKNKKTKKTMTKHMYTFGCNSKQPHTNNIIFSFFLLLFFFPSEESTISNNSQPNPEALEFCKDGQRTGSERVHPQQLSLRKVMAGSGKNAIGKKWRGGRGRGEWEFGRPWG